MRLPAPLAALVTPRRFFAESEHASNVLVALAVVTAVALLLTASLAGLGLVLASSVDATVTVDNPDRPPEPFCEEPTFEAHEEDCQEPAEIERDAGEILWEAFVEYLPLAFVAIYVVWLFEGTLVHLLARLSGGEGRWSDTMAVLGWAMPAELLQAAGALAFFAWLTAGEPITATSEAELQRELEALVAAVPEVNVLALVVGVWQVAVVAYGLSETHDMDPVGGAVAGGLVIVPVSLVAAL